jgi:hypothetical protein
MKKTTYIVTYTDYDGSNIQAEFDTSQEAEREWDWANAFDVECITITEYTTDEEE